MTLNVGHEKSMKLSRIALCAAILTAGCRSVEHSVSANSTDESASVATAVLQYEIMCYEKEWAATALPQGQKAGVYFLSVDYDHSPNKDISRSDFSDPNRRILDCFAGLTPPVKPVSLSTFAANGTAIDKKTGTLGRLFCVSHVSIASPEDAMVSGGYHVGGLYAAGFTYHLKKSHGRWIVVERKQEWVS